MIELASGSFQVTTIAGSPPLSGKVLGDIDNAIGTSATFNNPYQITTDGNSLFVACGTNESIRQISLTASGYPVTTIAGPKISFSGTRAGYVNGSALNCPGGQFNTPTGITTDGTNLYVTDVGNQVIRKIVIASGAVTTLAGAMPPLVTTAEIDGTGTAARFNNPVGITTDGVSLYVTDALSNAIRMIR
jgi:hypothetical protein